MSTSERTSDLPQKPVRLLDRLSQEAEAARKASQPLTPRKAAFVQHLLDGGTKHDAAVAAGSTEASAGTTATRYLKDPAVQSALAQHFLDQEGELGNLLLMTLMRLKGFITSGTPANTLRAAKLLLDYTRVATTVLGLDIKVKKDEKRTEETVSREELIARHREEIAYLERLGAGGLEVRTGAVREGQVPQ